MCLPSATAERTASRGAVTRRPRLRSAAASSARLFEVTACDLPRVWNGSNSGSTSRIQGRWGHPDGVMTADRRAPRIPFSRFCASLHLGGRRHARVQPARVDGQGNGRPERRSRSRRRTRVMADEAREFKAFEAAGWSRRASTYGRVTGAITARFVEPLLDAARVGAGMGVLDVATGPGHVAAAAAARGAEPVGVDIAEGMLAVARRDHPLLEFRAGDAEALPFADCAFD